MLITKRILHTAVLLFVFGHLAAQPFYKYRSFSIRDGLSADAISDMTQSPDGMMWFATMNGLCNYDGYSFTVFSDNKGADEVLTTNRMFKVKANTQGNIWCITYDRHLYLFDTHTCRFVDISERLARKYGQQFSFRGVFPLANGYTWIICDDATHSIFRIDDKQTDNDGALVKVETKALGIEGAEVTQVFLDANGGEWIVNNKAVMLYGHPFKNKIPYHLAEPVGRQVFFASSKGELACYQHGASALTPISIPGMSGINYLSSVGNSLLVIGTNAGVMTYNTSTGSFTHLGEGTDNIQKLFTDSRKRIWAVTTGNDILMYDGNRQEQRIPLLRVLPQTDNPNNISLTEGQGRIWVIPSNYTICQYDEHSRQLTPAVPTLSNPIPLRLPLIKKIYTDNQRALWYNSSNNKLSFLSFGQHNIGFHEVNKEHNTRAIYFDGGQRLWVGDEEGIVSIFDKEMKRVGYLSPDGHIQTAPCTFSSRIYAFYRDSKGRFWIGTKGKGLYMLDNGGLHHYINDPSDKTSLSSNDIYCIDEDELHHIWIGTFGGGLNLFSTSAAGEPAFVSSRNGLVNYPPHNRNGRIRRITHNGKGVVLLSTTNGLVTFSNHFTRPADIKFYCNRHVKGEVTSLLSNDVTQTLVTRDGDVYVVSMGGGIQKVTSDQLLTDHLTLVTQAKMATHNGIVLSMAEDANGKLWLGHEESINSYDPASETIIRYGHGVIDDNVEISEALPAVSPDGQYIAMGTMNGFVIYDAQTLKHNTDMPNIVFTSVQFQGETDIHPILHQAELNVPYSKRNLTINFAALDYSNSDNIRYAYRIEGVDKEWNYLLSSHSASFNDLPPGHLRLQVKSTNQYGEWGDNIATLAIYSHPTFWETPWAWLLYLVILTLFVVLGIYMYRIRTLASMERQMNRMKTRFFTEIGHKLRTPLTLIGGPVTEVLNSDNLSDSERDHLEKVQRNSRNMLELVNKMLNVSKDGNYIVDDADAPVFATSTSFINADADTRPHKDVRLMVVEDNNDLRSFLMSILQDDYTMIEAENGLMGLEKAQNELPDFIITDIMMPEMDGLTMIRHIKENPDICHIPIIVLSAKASLEDRLEGLKAGIDDYISKPFSATYLKQRIENIIGQRHMLQQTMLGKLGERITATQSQNIERFRLDEPQIVDADQEMMESLMKYIEKRIDDQDLKIEELADAVNLGRTVFYGKIKSIVGMSPSDFLRHVRMQRAEELVSKSQLTFSQIAYSVGFSDPKYFTKCFKKETGMTPSEYRQKAE